MGRLASWGLFAFSVAAIASAAADREAGALAAPDPPAALAWVQTWSYEPIHDAYVAAGSPSSNYGLANTLKVRSGNGAYTSYLKFDLTGVTKPIQKATLRLYCTDASPDGGTVYLVS